MRFVNSSRTISIEITPNGGKTATILEQFAFCFSQTPLNGRTVNRQKMIDDVIAICKAAGLKSEHWNVEYNAALVSDRQAIKFVAKIALPYVDKDGKKFDVYMDAEQFKLTNTSGVAAHSNTTRTSPIHAGASAGGDRTKVERDHLLSGHAKDNDNSESNGCKCTCVMM